MAIMEGARLNIPFGDGRYDDPLKVSWNEIIDAMSCFRELSEKKYILGKGFHDKVHRLQFDLWKIWTGKFPGAI